VSVVFFARVDEQQAKGADDAAEAKWWRLDKLPELAFDHADILKRAAGRIADRSS
jgi:8-oxo-dGTP diphosphatase